MRLIPQHYPSTVPGAECMEVVQGSVGHQVYYDQTEGWRAFCRRSVIEDSSINQPSILDVSLQVLCSITGQPRIDMH